MRYRYRTYRRQNRNYRRFRGGMYGFPWIFVFFLFFYTGWWQWLLIGLVVSVLLGVFFRTALRSAVGYDQQQQTYYQPNSAQDYQQPEQSREYYQPSSSQEYYQPDQSQDYQEYQEGYQPAPPSGAVQDVYKQPGKEPEKAASYQEYEQPQTEYPQQMPPM